MSDTTEPVPRAGTSDQYVSGWRAAARWIKTTPEGPDGALEVTPLPGWSADYTTGFKDRLALEKNPGGAKILGFPPRKGG